MPFPILPDLSQALATFGDAAGLDRAAALVQTVGRDQQGMQLIHHGNALPVLAGVRLLVSGVGFKATGLLQQF